MNFDKIKELINFKHSYLIIFLIILAYTYFVSDPLAKYFGITGYQDSFGTMTTLAIFSALLIAPILEELIFRSYFTGYRKDYLLILMQFLLAFIVLFEFFYSIFIIASILIAIFFIENKGKDKTIYVSKKLLLSTFILSSILFCILHYKNVESSSVSLSIAFTLIALLPGALFFGLVRYRNGIVAAMILHSIFNFSVLFLNNIFYD